MGKAGPLPRTIQEIYRVIVDNSIITDNCKVWQGHTAAGYGVISFEGRQVFIHRLIYERQNNISLTGNDVIRHSCDNKRCWEPSHLFNGTHADNVADKVAKGRHCHGVTHYKSGLTEDNVRAIRSSTESYGVLSARYKISRGGISNIKHRVTWRHVL